MEDVFKVSKDKTIALKLNVIFQTIPSIRGLYIS